MRMMTNLNASLSKVLGQLCSKKGGEYLKEQNTSFELIHLCLIQVVYLVGFYGQLY